MNKLSLLIISAIAALASASCSNCEESTPKTDLGKSEYVTFSCEVPAVTKSRALDQNGLFGDGMDADKLSYVIYSAGHVYLASTDENAPQARYTGDRKFTLTVPLRTRATEDDTYEVFFWADAWGDNHSSPYSFDWDAHTVTVDYNKSLGLYDKADAFAYFGSFVNPGSDEVLNFTLTRPFAQINIVTHEFNSFPEASAPEKDMKIGFAQKNDTDYYLPNVWNYKDRTYTTTTFGNVPDLSSIIRRVPEAFDARVHIKGVDMRYLYVGYVFPEAVHENVFSPATMTVEWLSNPASLLGYDINAFNIQPNYRYFIYPKDASDDPENPGPGFLTGNLNVAIAVMPGFDSSNEVPVDISNSHK